MLDSKAEAAAASTAENDAAAAPSTSAAAAPDHMSADTSAGRAPARAALALPAAANGAAPLSQQGALNGTGAAGGSTSLAFTARPTVAAFDWASVRSEAKQRENEERAQVRR